MEKGRASSGWRERGDNGDVSERKRERQWQ